MISPAPTAGRVLIRRSNKNVDLTLDGVTWASDTGTITRTNLIPAGFQPDAPVTHGATSPHPGSARAFTITSTVSGPALWLRTGNIRITDISLVGTGANLQRGGVRLFGKDNSVVASGVITGNTVVGYTEPVRAWSYDPAKTVLGQNVMF